VHPRNREAVAALKMVGDTQLVRARNIPERHLVACDLQRASDYFSKYPPVLNAIEEGELECPPAPND